jgi:hypothetical protein
VRVEQLRTFAGQNVYSHRPALLMRPDLEALFEEAVRHAGEGDIVGVFYDKLEPSSKSSRGTGPSPSAH